LVKSVGRRPAWFSEPSGKSLENPANNKLQAKRPNPANHLFLIKLSLIITMVSLKKLKPICQKLTALPGYGRWSEYGCCPIPDAGYPAGSGLQH
jgi:hypothetical protein